jgi:hypothetical protein
MICFEIALSGFVERELIIKSTAANMLAWPNSNQGTFTHT